MREVTAAIIRRNGKILICRRAYGSEELTAFEWCPADKAVAEELSIKNEHISL